MFIPVGTDAPIYHRPIATTLIAAANVWAFWSGGCFHGRPAPEFVLHLGQGLAPLQWLSCHFMHYGVMHLIGNLIFLFAFGIVVEGKLGWWRFLLFYLVTAIVGAAILQTAFLGIAIPREAAGASLAIFGLMAATLLWAPENEVEFLWCVSRYQTSYDTHSARYVTFCGYFFAKELLCYAFLVRPGMSSQLGHLMGAIVGGAFAALLLKRGCVDCEGWDLFTRWPSYRWFRFSAKQPVEESLQLESPHRRRTRLRQEVEQAAAAHNWEQVSSTLLSLSTDECLKVASEHELAEAGQWLFRQKRFEDAAEIWEHLRSHPTQTHAVVLLKLAAIYAEILSRPAAAQRILQAIRNDWLTPALQQHCDRIAALTKKQIEEGVVEVAC